MIREKVTELVRGALEKNPKLFLIDLDISEDNRICVVLDGDHGVTVEDCMTISRAIEHNLDREEFDFSLEVMSAGVSEPLTLPRQYIKNLGRTLKIKTRSGEIIEGNLTQADETQCTLAWKTREPKPIGKGKTTVQKEAVIPYADIAQAKVMVTF